MSVVIGVIVLIVKILTYPTRAGMGITQYLQILELLNALIVHQ
jgi:hypothetical protein